jgi:hypothetical protein
VGYIRTSFNTTGNFSSSKFFIIMTIVSTQGLGCTWLACGKRPERVYPIKEYNCDNEQECIEALNRAQSLADENCALVSKCAEGAKNYLSTMSSFT